MALESGALIWKIPKMIGQGFIEGFKTLWEEVKDFFQKLWPGRTKEERAEAQAERRERRDDRRDSRVQDRGDRASDRVNSRSDGWATMAMATQMDLSAARSLTQNSPGILRPPGHRVQIALSGLGEMTPRDVDRVVEAVNRASGSLGRGLAVT